VLKEKYSEVKHCVSKNVTPLACCNLDIHGQVLIIFGRNVTEKKQSNDALFSHLSQAVLLHYLAKQETW